MTVVQKKRSTTKQKVKKLHSEAQKQTETVLTMENSAHVKKKTTQKFSTTSPIKNTCNHSQNICKNIPYNSYDCVSSNSISQNIDINPPLFPQIEPPCINPLQAGQKSSDTNLQTFIILIKSCNKEAQVLGKKIASWLKKQGKNVFIVDAKIFKEELREIANKAQIILVLGGDGTMLATARKVYGIHIPLLGVNFGRVGFLTDISPNNWQHALRFLLDGGYEIQLYLPLSWELIRNNTCIEKGIAINDVVVARGCIATSINISISLDDIFLSDLHSDGIICSTPLGATAYSAAANGPLVFPALDAHTITPISPFAGSFPPLVLPKESFVKIQACKGGDIAITIDGQKYFPVIEGDSIYVKTAQCRIPMFVQHPHWFWQRLTERGFIMPGPGTYTQ